MDVCRDTLGFLLLLQQTLCFSNPTVFLEKHIGTEADMTPLCNNDTDNTITAIHCAIKKEENGDVCKLHYVRGQRNETECDSRITLTVQNQTVFLLLMDLTPADSGVFNCSCTNEESISTLRLNVTVKEAPENGNESSSVKKTVWSIALVSSTSIIFTSLILVLIAIRKLQRQQLESQLALQDLTEEQIDPYSTFIETKEGLYSIVKLE